MKTSTPASNLRLLSAMEVAGWQIPSLASNNNQCTAKLPALQRSAVWKPRQVELLWDSLLRGFPVGSFLLTPFQRDRKTQEFLHATHETSETVDPDYHLLDGQQRCNAISLGFLNSWELSSNHSAALWIDLDRQGVTDEREYVFRVITRSHPWGYQRNDPSKTLEYRNRRKALTAYNQAFKLSNIDAKIECSFGNSSLLKYAWPWDALCPIPFPFLIEAIKNSEKDVWKTLEYYMSQRLPYWHSLDDIDSIENSAEKSWKTKLASLIDKPTQEMNQLIFCIKNVIGTKQSTPFQIPALILNDVVTEAPSPSSNGDDVTAQPNDTSTRQDPVETLFIRINSAGTPLQGEELNYSILKSIWPSAQDVVEELSTCIMAPSRLVALVSRLILAKSVHKDNRPPAILDVSRFRRLVHGRDSQCPDFLETIQKYLSNGNGKQLFDIAQKLLTANPRETVTFRLPAVLTSDIARTSPEIFFILLVWIDRLIEEKIDPLVLDESIRRRLIGAITALSWFSEDVNSCVTVLWKRLQNHSSDDLNDFFSTGSLKDCIEIQENGRLPLIPLLPPHLLKESVEKSLYGLGNGVNQTWQTWKWWDNFNGILPKSESAKKWYARKIKKDSDEVEFRREAWTKFTNALWGKREIVLFAQREWLVKWFPDYDPSSHEQLEDTDRPWDFDHIHPQKYIYGRWNIPQVIKDWHGSIGNFRAWPFELNRSDAESVPRIKFKDACDEDNRFSLKKRRNNGELNSELLKASFIMKSKDWPKWEACAPNKEGFEGNYLANAKTYGECRVSLISAITQRWVELYREWYSELLIKDLFK